MWLRVPRFCLLCRNNFCNIFSNYTTTVRLCFIIERLFLDIAWRPIGLLTYWVRPNRPVAALKYWLIAEPFLNGPSIDWSVPSPYCTNRLFYLMCAYVLNNALWCHVNYLYLCAGNRQWILALSTFAGIKILFCLFI